MSIAKKPRPERITTTLRIERGHHVLQEGETVIMERELSRRLTAVTVHKIKAKREHSQESGVWLIDAVVTMRDIAREEDEEDEARS